MPRTEQYRGGKLTNREVLKLFADGTYWVDLNEGALYSDNTRAQVSTYEGNVEGHLFVRLYSQPKYRTMPLSHAVWMFGTQSEIPKGWQIHHVDRDVHNNSFANLVCVHPIDHRKLHVDDPVEEVPF